MRLLNTWFVIVVILVQFAFAGETKGNETGDFGKAKPNVIVIMADDIGFECYSQYGSDFYKTPNIDELAKTGARFTQAYSQPICTPSRVKIMTGRYNFRNYTQFGELDLTQPTFATMVKQNGYHTAIAGKWQLSSGNLNGPGEVGFDEYCLWHFSKGGAKNLSKKFANKGSRYKSPRLFQNGQLLPNTENKYGPDLVSDFICDFIERKKEQPFFIYYPMILVHSPFEPTPDSRDWAQKDKNRKPIEHFRDMVHYMDKVIGKIINKLDETGVRENTLIIVTGDNGTHRNLTSPFPGRGAIAGGKGLMQDAGNRVAFVANWPSQIKPGAIIDSPVGFADVLPTVAQATGSNVPDGVDGDSFLPQLKGDHSNARGWVFQSYSKNGPGAAPYRCFVRDADWKLYSDGSLYNIPEDWLEKSPVTGPEGDAARAKLKPVLDRILKQVPDKLVDRSRPVDSK